MTDPTNRVSWQDKTIMLSPIPYGLCMSERAFNRELRRLNVDRAEVGVWLKASANACVHWFAASDSRKTCAIVCVDPVRMVAEGRTGMQIAAVLAHEAVHLWQFMRRDIGEEAPSEEFEAYAIQFIVQNLLEAYAEGAGLAS